MYTYIFGPVQSRRFGLSLGIDLSPTQKSCNFDCLYCELKPARVVDHIENPLLVEDVIKDVQKALIAYKDIDVITITANGEPTLYPYLKELVERLNAIKKEKKLLILSNASNIVNPKIQNILQDIDIVKLSLDCATQKCFKKIDRPKKDIDVLKIIEGLKAFRNIFKHSLVLEVLVVSGINDKIKEFQALKTALDEINPDRVDLGTIDRPPAYDVKGVSTEKLKELRTYLGKHNVSIIHKEKPDKRVDFSKEEILATIQRRPQSEGDVAYLFSEKSQQNLSDLLKSGKIVKKNIAGVIFYT